MYLVGFSNGKKVDKAVIEKACDRVLEAIEKELPEEALSYEAYEFVISESAQRLKQKRIVLRKKGEKQ